MIKVLLIVFALGLGACDFGREQVKSEWVVKCREAYMAHYKIVNKDIVWLGPALDWCVKNLQLVVKP